MIPPRGAHKWIPTPTIGKGGAPGGNYNVLCLRCGALVTKRQLLSDQVPSACKRTRKEKAA